jgi:hypothetical protein
MIVPVEIRRRLSEIESRIDDMFGDRPNYGVSSHIEEFIGNVSRDISVWSIHKYYNRYTIDYLLFHKKVDELVPVMKYLFREKLTRYWNGVNKKGE